MGGGSSKPTKKNDKRAVDFNWESVQSGQNYNIVRNKNDGRQAQQYSYTLDNRYDPCNQADIFQRRNKSTLPIVRSFDHQWEAKGKGLVPKNNFRVITQRIPHRLTNCPQLSVDQSLYVLDRALQGYNFLYKNVGPFDVNSNMIGFTTEGEAKVWHNQNFGKNYPYHQKRTLQSTRIDETHKYDSEYVPLQEIQMVRNIVNIVQDRCQQGQFPQPFRTTIRQNIGFQQARRLVEQELNDSQRVRLNRVDLLRNVVKSKVSRLDTRNFSQSNLAYTNYGTVPANRITQVLPSNGPVTTQVVSPVNYNTTSTYQTNYAPGSNIGKNAYSFSYQKPVYA